ncbi:hypothetical protein IFM89_027176 [Coptis chinensis]|uniref:Uncharacterized protein n=1 Tax=Coptis chinensis TaxID=261450 RepID=A0A835IDE2_9MAGN|nr:hypothetical protein IFM89_027176 [Coptis chinensis]
MAFYLWNPSTKEYRELPEAFSKYQSKYFNVVYGFGYESTHDEYKVIRIRDGILLFANCFIGFPANRVIGSGTNLNSSKFRFLIVDQLDVNTQDVQLANRMVMAESNDWTTGVARRRCVSTKDGLVVMPRSCVSRAQRTKHSAGSLLKML